MLPRHEPHKPDDRVSPHDRERGRAVHPAQTPGRTVKQRWKGILSETKQNLSEDNISIVAGGVAFFILVAIFPAIAAALSIYGLVADPGQIKSQFDAMSSFLPQEARTLIEGQMTRISSQRSLAGGGAAISIFLALWSASKGMKALINALNIAYHVEDSRGMIKQSLVALGLTLFLIVLGLVSVGLVVAAPSVLGNLGLGQSLQQLISIGRWPLLFVVALGALAVIYRYGPNRERPRWRWLSWGAAVATLLWLGGSALFSFYVSNFGSYNKTYGSLAAVVVLALWFYVSAYVALLGAELNASIERQSENQPVRA